MVLQHLSRVKFGINHFFHGPNNIFGPDETLSNLLGAVFEATNHQKE